MLAAASLAAALACGPVAAGGGATAKGPVFVLAAASGGPSLLSAGAAPPPFCLAALAGNAQVRLAWLPPKTGDQLAVYEGTVPDFSQASLARAATGLGVTVTGLDNGTTYYFWLAVPGQAPDIMSNMVRVIPAAGAVTSGRVPAIGFCLAATGGDSQVQLWWRSVSGTDVIQGDKVAIYDGTVADFSQAHPAGTATGTSASVTKLANGTPYYFWLAVGGTPVNLAVGVQPGRAVSNMASAVPVAVPGAPDKLTVTPGDSRVTLDWTVPESGGAPIRGYRIYQGTSPGGEASRPVNDTLIPASPAAVTGLANGTTYYFKVAAVNQVGDGQLSGEEHATPATVPQVPSGLAAAPDDGKVTLSWAAPASDGGSPVTGYDLYVGTTADFGGSHPLTVVNGTAVTVTGLADGTTYYFKVAAVNRVGEGQATEQAAVPRTVPGAPVRLTATPGDSRVTLDWIAPPSGGAPIKGYLIYQGTSPGGETGTLVGGSVVTGTSYTVTGLANGTTYYFRVAAVNAAGQSPLSEETPATLKPVTPPPPSSPSPSSSATSSDSPTHTPSGSATSPSSSPGPSNTQGPAVGAPTGLIATAGNTRVHLSWTPPVPDSGSPVAGYRIYATTRPDGRESVVAGTAEGAGATVTGLANGTVYFFRVTAFDATGDESPSSTPASAEPSAGGAPQVPVNAGLPTRLVPFLLAAFAAGAITLIARRYRRVRPPDGDHPEDRREESHHPVAAPDVRAEADTAGPPAVSVRETGPEPTRTIRLIPHAGATTTILKETRT